MRTSVFGSSPTGCGGGSSSSCSTPSRAACRIGRGGEVGVRGGVGRPLLEPGARAAGGRHADGDAAGRRGPSSPSSRSACRAAAACRRSRAAPGSRPCPRGARAARRCTCRARSERPSGSFGSWNALDPSSPAEAEVHVQAAAAAVVERPAQERRELAAPLGRSRATAAGTGTPRRPPGSRRRSGCSPRRRRCRTRCPSSRRGTRTRAPRARSSSDACRTGRRPCRCRTRGGRQDRTGRHAAAPVGLHEVELELERDLRLQAHRSPGLDRLAQRVARVEGAGSPCSCTSAIPISVSVSQPGRSESRSSIASMSCRPTSNWVPGTGRISLSCVSG